MTTVPLRELLAVRDEGMRAPHLTAAVRARRRARAVATRIRAIDLAPIARILVLMMVFISRHVLVLGGCASLVISAAIVTPSLGWLAAGAALFFLEARRK